MSKRLAPGQRVLGALAIRGAPPAALLAELVPQANPARLIANAHLEGLDRLLYANLRRAGLLESLPSQAQLELAARYHETAARNMRFAGDLTRLSARLGDHGVDVVVIKGMALLDSLYLDPGLRPTGDVDLWVDAGDLDGLLAALGEEGFRAKPFYPDVHFRGSTTIDIHVHLLGAERVRARAHILAAGHDLMVTGTETSGYGAATRRLATPQHLLLLGLHLLKHNAERLLWLVELNELVRRCSDDDWERLLVLAGRMQQSASIRQTGYLARTLLPDAVADRYVRAAADRELGRVLRAVLRRRASHGQLPSWGPLIWYSSQRGILPRAASAIETLFPRPVILRQIFQDTRTSLWRLYVRRFGQLVVGVFR